MERLEKFSDPRVIPLPSSPPPRVRIASRRPPGWVSTLPDIDTLDDDNHAAPTSDAAPAADNGIDAIPHTTAQPASRTRHAVAALGYGRPSVITTSSVRARGPSRRVSSTMSYALIAARSASRTVSGARAVSATSQATTGDRRASTPGPLTPALTDARSISDATGASRPQTPHFVRPSFGKALADDAVIRMASEREVDEYEQALDTPLPPTRPATPSEADSTLDRPEWLDEVLEERRADEEWMGYVRAQLGALFPDFVDSSTPSTQAQSVTGNTDAAEWSNGGEAGRSLVDNVPSVRSEINGLRDEIERLRGVVGGLASDLSAGVPGSVATLAAAAASAAATDAGDEDDRAAVEGLLGDGQANRQSGSASSGPESRGDGASIEQHRHVLADILGSLSLIFPRPAIDKLEYDQLFSAGHLAHLRDSLRNHLAS